MKLLVDTNILVRLANLADALYPIATGAVLEMHRRGETLHITAQNLVEFRSVATRPIDNKSNGLGMAPSEAEAKSADFEAQFVLLPEIPDIYPAWKALVAAARVTGKQVHDARLVAVCHVHGITHLMTFNTSHFVRLSGFGPGVVVVDPAIV